MSLKPPSGACAEKDRASLAMNMAKLNPLMVADHLYAHQEQTEQQEPWYWCSFSAVSSYDTAGDNASAPLG